MLIGDKSEHRHSAQSAETARRREAAALSPVSASCWGWAEARPLLPSVPWKEEPLPFN